MAVMESLAKLAAVGADPAAARLTFQEYFERLGDKPERWGKPAAALLGAFAAQLGMGVPSIGGKDSMSGSFNELDVPPTLVSFALAMTKASATASAAFKKAGSPIALLSLPMADDQPDMPDFAAAKRLNSAVAAALREGKFLSASVVKEGRRRRLRGQNGLWKRPRRGFRIRGRRAALCACRRLLCCGSSR